VQSDAIMRNPLNYLCPQHRERRLKLIETGRQLTSCIYDPGQLGFEFDNDEEDQIEEEKSYVPIDFDVQSNGNLFKQVTV